MSEIKILHLYSRLLSLYGEYGNIAILDKVLTHNGHSVTIDRMEYLPDNLGDYDLVYTGAGTEGDIVAAAQRLQSKNIADYLEKGGIWLATGNSMALLGKSIEYDGAVFEGLGALDFATAMSRERRWLGDALTTADNIFGKAIIGYVNTSSVYKGIENGLFTFALGTDLGNDKQSATDGIIEGGIIATQLTGPLLVKNPAVLQYMYQRLTGEALQIADNDPLNLAYDNALRQLSARLG